MRFASLIALFSAAGAISALADNNPAPPPIAPPTVAAAQHIHGKIDSYDPATRTLDVTTSDKKTVTITLESDARVIYDTRLKLTDIKAGDFLGAATLKTSDGKLHAQEVHVFPESMRGVGEGQYPANDAASNRLMTNATVAEVAPAGENKGTITLNFRGAAAAADGSCTGRAGAGAGCSGTAEILIAPGIPMIGLMVGDVSLLTPGMAISVSATPASDGTLKSSRLSVEKDGVKPIL